MFRLILPFLDMLRFRSGPQDLPASRGFMVLLAALYLAGGFLAGEGEPALDEERPEVLEPDRGLDDGQPVLGGHGVDERRRHQGPTHGSVETAAARGAAACGSMRAAR